MPTLTMSKDDNSMDGEAVPNGEVNESGVSDNGSENGADDSMDDKLDPADRELYEKLKQQEREEREEIERELKAHDEALSRRHDELRARDLRFHEKLLEHERVQDLRINKHDRERDREDYHHRSVRDGPLKDHAPPRLDFFNHSAYLAAAAAAAAAGYPRSHSPTSTSPSQSPTDGPAHHWTFEEQFKQLYEINDDPKRREFLDDLFQFMQKRGTPVNRIPIMAKQTLDLYELFKLVVSKGGLVEVINKKLWREITKGLNLPSSITSAAFTLRTQYMKYLYPYECEKLKLSSPQELQSAIDGNRREGRRSGYGYDLSPGPTLIPPSHPAHHHLNGSLLNGKFSPTAQDRRSPLSSLQHLWRLQAQQLCGDDDSLPPTPSHRSLTDRLAERDALAMEAASRAMEEATRKMEEASRAAALVVEENSPPRKRLHTDDERIMPHASIPAAHLKITSRNDGRSEIDNSLVVSMEINGIMYQGVLFAHQPSQRRI